jgi:hypothetical protein
VPGQSLAQIAQAATDQAGRPHSRQPSVEMTPRYGVRPFPESPNQRPITPAGAQQLKDDKRDGPGASASPSLRNLLS